MKHFLLRHKLAITISLVYFIVNLVYSYVTNVTWDDDCPVRYYNTVNALNDPETFVSLWNRPLFTLIFFIPLQFGKFTIPIVMCAITVISSFMLYLALKKQEMKNAYMVLPFIFFQTYFFGISRNAESEPLAVAVLCLGYYFMVEKKWLWFAIIGGLLPLARLELCLLFPFWGIILLQAKMFKYILVLAVPFVLWNIAGGIITGDFAYVFSSTFGKENATNRYGHTSFGHYFQRYIYVIGPILFFFFVFGMVKAFTSKLRVNVFVFWQFCFGFLIYVLFSWKLNMGNSAGFMRNLTPISALTAIIALWGFNFWWDLIRPIKVESDLLPVDKSVANAIPKDSKTKYRKKNKLYRIQQEKEEKKKARALLELKAVARKKSNKGKRKYVVIVVLCAALFWLTFQFFSYKMSGHQNLSEDRTYDLNKWVVLSLIALTFILIFVQISKKVSEVFTGVIITVCMLIFTALTETPNANASIERTLMEVVSNDFQNEFFDSKTKYINHVWFYWANDLDRADPIYKAVTMSNLDSAEVGSICVWEPHYSSRLGGDVSANYFKENLDWVALSYYAADSTRFRCTIYEKIDLKQSKGINEIKKYIAVASERSSNYVSLGQHYYYRLKDKDSALIAYNNALEIDSNDIYAIFNKGVVHYADKNWEQASEEFSKCTVNYPKWFDGWMNLGLTKMNLKQYQESINVLNKAIEIDKEKPIAYLNRAASHLALKDTSSAITDFSHAIDLDKKNYQAYIKRGILFFGRKNLVQAEKDFKSTVNINPNYSEGWRLLGITQLNLNKKVAAKQALEKALALGNPSVAQLLKNYF